MLVVGGGCCGCAAALTLARHTRLRVLVLEGSRYEAARAGETVSAAFPALLDYLGVGDALCGDIPARPHLAHDAAWGSDRLVSHEATLSRNGGGFFVDRRAMDRFLAGRVSRAGTRLRRGAWLRRVERANHGWTSYFEVGGRTHAVIARQVIDATGRRAAFARRADAEVRTLDKLVAVIQRFTPDAARPLTPSTLVESAADGWWYSAPLPDGQGVLAFMTDADLLAVSRVSQPKAFDQLLAATAATRERVRGCRCSEKPQVVSSATQFLESPLGDGWIAAGDAALALDPLSSLGIGHAVVSGIQAARIAAQRLNGDDALASTYAADTRTQLGHYLELRHRLYATESRWPLSPFWQRRH